MLLYLITVALFAHGARTRPLPGQLLGVRLRYGTS